jgi:VIT1/CCC1 family predicted Fe2+/Mn2+ transporter
MAKSQALYLRDWVFGGMDGTVTTFAVAAGAAGAGLSPSIVIVMGLANLFADGFSMAAGNFVSSRAERDNAERLQTSDRPRIDVGCTPPPEQALAVRSPLTAALFTFFAFAAFGLVPLVPYLARGGFAASIVATAITFFVIGAVKSRWSLQPAWKSGLETLAIGGSAAVLAFVTGHFLARWFT